MFSRPFADIDRLYLHVGLYHLSIAVGSTFSIGFLLLHGLSPAAVFLAIGAILALRFCVRPLALWLAPRLGIRRTLMLGCLLNATQFLALPKVDGFDVWLALFIVAVAVGEGVYWTAFHTCFALVGETKKFGGQVGLRQMAQSIANVVGPPLGGLALTYLGSWQGFALAALVRLAAAAPLLRLTELPAVQRNAPPDAWQTARFGAIVFVSDGWFINTAWVAWSIVVFQGLGGRYDAYGSALAAAAFVGAVAGVFLGRVIDRGHGRSAVALNLAASLAVLAAQAFCATTPAVLVAVMVFAALLGGFSLPAMMTAIYAHSQASPCPFRYQFACEGGWDSGGALACLAGALTLHLGAPLQAVILLAVPMLVLQAAALAWRYGPRVGAVGGI